MSHPAETAPAILMEGVNKYYGAFQALKGIDFRVANGERIVLCGPSGSGKSTLVRCINRLETVQSGRIVVDGIDLAGSRKNVDAVRRDVGMVFQQFNLFPHMTVLENCMLAPLKVRGTSRDEARATAMRLLVRVQIEAQANKYPAQLSGGQQQRVAVARALVANPTLILADEPTGNLDTANGEAVMEMLTHITNSGTTIVMVTHSEEHAKRAHRVVNMLDGRFVDHTEL